jgi:hypothetical protein
MSNTYTQTHYQVSLDVEGNDAQLVASIDMPGQLGITDDLAMSFVETLKTFPWPTGSSVVVQVNKSTQTSVIFDTHMNTNPPSFS